MTYLKNDIFKNRVKFLNWEQNYNNDNNKIKPKDKWQIIEKELNTYVKE